MDLRTCLVALVVVLAPVACGSSPGPDEADGTWVGTIATEGNVTTVINESGSLWSGPGKLVEEAVIGVEAGPEEYMFGDLFAVQVTDEHIYVTDEQTDTVHRYGLDGVFVDDVGATGQGPGEYGDPAMVAIVPDGRIIVFDFASDRMQVYDPGAAPLDTWPAPGAGCCRSPMITAADGTLWVPANERDPETGELVYAIQVFGPDGPTEPRYVVKQATPPGPTTVEAAGFRMSMPFAPQFVWTLAAPRRVIAGASDSYRFEVQEAGEIVRVVRKSWEPVPIAADYRDWLRKRTIAIARQLDADWSWSGSGMPTHYPAYDSLIAARSGETWVSRYTGGVRHGECADPLAEAGPASAAGEPCWQETFVLDVFDGEGRFLGEVPVPPGVTPHPLRMNIDGDRVVAVCENEEGVYQVKRYRLVVPGESER